MLPQQLGAEAVHRFDVRLVHPEHLLPQMAVAGVLSHPGRQLGGQLAPQLRCRGPGVGDDEKIVHMAVLLH